MAAMMQPTKTIIKSDFFIMKYLSVNRCFKYTTSYAIFLILVHIFCQKRHILIPKKLLGLPSSHPDWNSSVNRFILSVRQSIRPSFCPSFRWVYPSVPSVRRFHCAVFPRGSTNYHTIYPAYSKHLTYILSSTYNIYYTNLFQYTSIT